jgi:hypothetical protein
LNLEAGLIAFAENGLPGLYTVAGLPAATSYPNKLAMTTQGLYQSVGGVWQPLYNPTNATLGISTGSPGAQGQTGAAYTLPLTATQGTPLSGGGYNWLIVYQMAVSGTANTFVISNNGTTTAALTCADPTNVSTTLVWVQCSDAAGVQVQKGILIPIAAPATAAATPTFSPIAGAYGVPQTVTISCSTPSPTIYYTTNGSTPTTSSPVYSSPITVGTSQTVQAIATASGFLQSAVGSAAYIINTVQNPIAVNVPSNGGTGAGSNYFEGLPLFKNRVREGQGFAVPGSSATTPVALDANGWPLADFQCVLWAFAGGFALPSWTSGTFTCGFIGNGNETVQVIPTLSSRCVVDTVVAGTGGAYTTFHLHSVTGNFGFEIINSTYAVAGISKASSAVVTLGSGVTGSNPFSVGCPIKFSGIVGMTQINGMAGTVTAIGGSSGAYTVTCNINSSAFTAFSATGTPLVNSVIDVFAYLPEYPGSSIDTVTASSAFTNEAIAYYGQFFALRNMEGSGALTNSTVNTSSTRATAVNKQACFYTPTLEGQPAEWTAALAMACGVGMWLNTPAIEDSGFTWAQSLATWLNANVPTGTPIFIEVADELWNGYNARYNITGLTLGASTTVAFTSNNSSNPYAVNNVVGFAGINYPSGTSQLNTQFGTVTAIGGTNPNYTITVNINSTGYSPWTSGGIVTNSVIGNLGGACASNNAFVASGFPNYPTYYANMIHGLAAALRGVFGARYGTDVRLVQAWQTTGNGVYFHSQVYNYYQTQGWNFAADVYCLSAAPYMNLQNSQNITATMSATGVLTVTAGSNIKPGGTLAGSGVGSGIVIQSQLTTNATSLPLINSTGTYQTNYSGAALASTAMTVSTNLASTVSQIETALSAIAVNQPFGSMIESINAQSLTYCGRAMTAYECGWQTNTENVALTNSGAAIMDTSVPGMTGVMNAYSAALINSGVQPQFLFQGGIDSNDNPATVARAPIDWMSTIYPIVAATCPRLASAASFITGASPTRNLVSGGGATINGANWADNPSFNNVLGNFSDNGLATTQGPFYGTSGLRTYIVNCTAPGTYPLVANITTTNSGQTTNLYVNGVEVVTGAALPASTTGNVSLGNVTLQEGANCFVFGKGGTPQSGVQINNFNFP